MKDALLKKSEATAGYSADTLDAEDTMAATINMQPVEIQPTLKEDQFVAVVHGPQVFFTFISEVDHVSKEVLVK